MPSNDTIPPTQTSINRRATYFRLLGYLKPYRKRFLLAIMATALYAIAEASLASLMQPLLDGTFIDKEPFFIRWIPIIIALVFIGRSLMAIASELGMQSVSTGVMRDVRAQLFDHTLHLPDTLLTAQSPGEVQSLFVFNTQQMLNATTGVLTVLIRDSLVVVVLIGFIFFQHWQLASILFLIIPVIALVTRAVNVRLKRLSHTMLAATGSIGTHVNEAMTAHRELKIYHAESLATNRFTQANETVRRTTLGVTRARIIASQLSLLVTVLAMAGMIYAAIHFAERGSLTVGKFIAIFTAMAMLLTPIKRLTTVNEQLQRGISAAETVFAWLDQPIEPESIGSLEPESLIAGDIEIDNISVRYPGSEKTAIEQLSLTIKQGTTTALVGLSGSGKTTLLHTLPRLIELDTGQIRFGTTDITQLSRNALRASIGYVGQFPMLFDLSVAENILFSTREQPSEQELADIKVALQNANALEFVEQLPNGLTTKLGPNGASLSGGQRQRIALARALYHSTPYLLLDEVTSALDADSEQQIQSALQALQGQKTVIIIAHRLSTIRSADQIVVMAAGKIIEQGSHETLLALGGSYHELVKQQSAT